MNRKEQLLFIGFLALIFIFEGLGIENGRFISLILIIIFSIGFFAFTIYKKGKIGFDKKLTFPLVFLFVFTALSTLFSVNKVNSLTYLMFYLSIIPVFLFTNIFKKVLSKPILYSIFSASIIYCLYSMVSCLPAGRQVIWSFVSCPTNGYQLVSSFFGSHNHLGDFLILPLISCYYLLLTGKQYNTDKKPSTSLRASTKQHEFGLMSVVICQLLVVFFLPFFLFSYSRSAYLSLFLTLIILIFYLFKNNKLKTSVTSYGLIVMTLIFTFIFLLSVFPASNNPLKNVHSYLETNQQLKEKTLFASRGEYAREAILSTIDRPIFGVGAGNFIFASIKYNPIKGLWTESSHNIFLDIASEMGVITFIIFITIIIVIFRKSEKNIFFFMALGMLFNFQTDYTFRIYSVLLLFFILLGLSYEEKSG